MATHSINYGSREITFQLIRKKLKNINLSIKPDMTIVVSASEEVPLDYILRFVKGKAPWITKNVGYFKDTQKEKITPREYISGETYKYLGRQYRLRVEQAEIENIRYFQGFIELKLRDKKDFARKEKLVNGWFREKAELNFALSLKKIYPLIEKYGIPLPTIQIRTMKARWGSCLRDKNEIMLNYELIKAPKFCIDYVILHELIHFTHENHNADFYNFLTMLMPDWKERKAILDEEVVRNL